MDLSVPQSFSPSSLSQFTSCPLAFRYAYIEHRPRVAQLASTKGTIVHRCLEKLLLRKEDERTRESAHIDLDDSFDEFLEHPDLADLELDEQEHELLVKQSHKLIDNYFEIEDPKTINPIGLELKLEASFDDTLLRGIIDRLEIIDGELVVTDYKTGSVPKHNSQTSKMVGVQIYALLCEKIFGRTPAKVQLLYLSAPAIIVAKPTLSSLRGAQLRSQAIHKAVETACDKEDFRPSPSVLCNWCAYKELCPIQGGIIPDE